MPTEVASANRDLSQDIEDLQSRYAKRRKEIVDTQRQDLEELNQNYEKRKQQLETSHDAVINHIQKDQTERMQGLRTENDTLYKNSKESNAKILENIKHTSDESRKMGEDQVHNAQEQTGERIKEIAADPRFLPGGLIACRDSQTGKRILGQLR